MTITIEEFDVLLRALRKKNHAFTINHLWEVWDDAPFDVREEYIKELNKDLNERN